MADDSFADFLEAEDENEEIEWMSTLRDGVIFLIDCTTTMVGQTLPPSSLSQQEADDKTVDTGVRLGFLCAQTFMQNKAIGSPDDLVGLVLMRTTNSSFHGFDGINVVQTLDLVSAPRILELERLRKMPKDQFQLNYGSKSSTAGVGFPIHEGLWACQHLFDKSPKPLGYKRIFLLTDEPDPIGKSAQLKRQSLAKATDLRQSNIELEVLPIQQEGVEFDFNIFYKTLLQEVEGDDGLSTLPDPSQRIEELLNRVNSTERRRRRLARLPFFLLPLSAGDGEDLAEEARMVIGVSSYCLVRSAGIPKQIRLASSTNAPVKSQRRFYKVPKGSHGKLDVAYDPDNLVLPQDLVKGLVVGTRTICFDRHELAGRMHQFVPVGIHLLGFKPLKKLRPWYHLRAAQFIYPDESTAKFSTLWFTTLLSVCLTRRVFAFALYVQSKGSAPRLVALVPQAEKLSDDGAQLAPSGFHIMFMPFMDDFRAIKLPNVLAASFDEVEIAKNLIRKLLIAYDPDSVGNPRLLRHYAELEALALERTSTLDTVPDHTMPNLKVIKRRAGDALSTFESTFSLNESASPPKKRPKKEDNSDQMTADHLASLVEVDGLNKLTVPQLKQGVALLRLKPASGRKADLIETIKSHFAV